MDKEELLRKLEIDSLKESIMSGKQVCPYHVFKLRDELMSLCKDDQNALLYLKELVAEAEVSLENILNFYPHRVV